MVSRGFLPHPAGEPADRFGIVGGVLDGLSEQGQGADRRLQLVADVGDEVAPDLLDPPVLGLVLGEHQDQAIAADVSAQRGDPDGEAGHPAAETARG